MAGPTRYCPACYSRNQWEAEQCAACGASLVTADSFEDRLVWALDHPDTATAMLAAELLGRRGAKAAISRLIEITGSSDSYRAAAAARALTMIDDRRARTAVRALRKHSSAVVRRAVASPEGRADAEDKQHDAPA